MSQDYSAIYAKYAGKWVAFADDEITVIASGNDAKTALMVSAENGVPEPILFRVPDEIVEFVGCEDSIPSHR